MKKAFTIQPAVMSSIDLPQENSAKLFGCSSFPYYGTPSQQLSVTVTAEFEMG
jgi:hypothetical protein